MINTFEKETKPLTDWEMMHLLPAMVKELSQHVSRRSAIKSDYIAERMLLATGQKPNGARIRKIVNHIRITGMIPCLVATSEGYYVAANAEEIADCVISLQQRAKQIDQVAQALHNQMLTRFPMSGQMRLF